MTTPGAHREQEIIYAAEIERGVDSDVMAEIGFRPPEVPSGSPAAMSTEGVPSEAPEIDVIDEGTPLAEGKGNPAAPEPDDMTWQHEAYAEYLEQQRGEQPPSPQAPRTARGGRRRGPSRRLAGRAAVIAEGRGTDPDLM